MKRFATCITVLALALCSTLAFVSPSHAQLGLGKPAEIKMTFSKPVFPPVFKDTIQVSSFADTVRTNIIDLSDLDWAAALQQTQLSTAGYPIAEVTFIATKFCNVLTDTLHFSVEQVVTPYKGMAAFGGTNCAGCCTSADTTFDYNPLSLTTPNTTIGGIAVCRSAHLYNSGSPGGLPPCVFKGVIMVDPHAATSFGASADVYGLQRFRLQINGDYATGSTASGLMGFVRYIRKP